MTLEQIMTRHVVTATMDTPIKEIREIFDRYKFHHVVVTEHGKAVGVVSDRDLLKTISPFVGKMGERTQDVASLQKKAHQVMTRQLVCGRTSMPITDAVRLLLHHNVSCLPVVDEDDHCVGIVTWHDFLRWAINLPCAVDGRPDMSQDAA